MLLLNTCFTLHKKHRIIGIETIKTNKPVPRVNKDNNEMNLG